jgi:hypothetical protein
VSIEGAKVVAGMIVEDMLTGRCREQKLNPDRMEIANIPGYSKVYVRWIVKGDGKCTVSVKSTKGGTASALKQ